MSAAQTYRCSRGEMTITPRGASIVGGIPVDEFEYCYRPPVRLAAQVPIDISVTMRCVVADDGVRRFVPAGGWEAFQHQAFAIGLAILDDERLLGSEGRSSYRAMYQAFRLVRQMNEHLDRQFNWSEDLFIRRSGRETDSERNVLPSGLRFDGVNDAGLSCRQLTRRGREEARHAGLGDVSSATAIRYGLMAFARKTPLGQLEPSEIRNLIRRGLFAIDPTEWLEETIVEQAAERLVMTLERYSELNLADFERLYVSGVDSWLRNAASRKRCSGGVMTKEKMRQAMLLLGWRAFDHVADCLLMFNKWFLAAVPEELSVPELNRFLQVFGRQPQFSNLPLVLLTERSTLLGPVLSQLIEDPEDEQLVATLHRLLDIYANMCAERRRADRATKRRRRDGTSGGRYEQTNQNELFEIL